MYSKEKILSYLKDQSDLKSAIDNLNHMDYDIKVVEKFHPNKVLLYLNSSLSQTEVKQRLIDHMGENGWEYSGYEEIQTLKELCESLEIKFEKNGG